MADAAKNYAHGSNAKLAGLGFDAAREIDWRMGWLETRPELNRGDTIPADWAQQVQEYRRGLFKAPAQPVITLELPDEQAEALAQLVKRIGWTEIRQNAKDDSEGYAMREALEGLAKALAAAGYSPR